MSLQEAYRLGLDLEKLEKAFVQLPDGFRKNQHVLEGYRTAVYVVPLLYSSHEYLFTTITIGNIIQNLLEVVDRSPNTGPTTKAKRLDLNVSFEEIMINNQSRIFDFEYFWHNVRSKFAHVTMLSRYGIEEPSPETARKSVGLLCVFLKEYPARVARLGDETTT